MRIPPPQWTPGERSGLARTVIKRAQGANRCFPAKPPGGPGFTRTKCSALLSSILGEPGQTVPVLPVRPSLTLLLCVRTGLTCCLSEGPELFKPIIIYFRTQPLLRFPRETRSLLWAVVVVGAARVSPACKGGEDLRGPGTRRTWRTGARGPSEDVLGHSQWGRVAQCPYVDLGKRLGGFWGLCAH